MPYQCFKCHKEVSLQNPNNVGRRDSCPACQADLHVCLNCVHYDPSCYNECRESQAERVLDKDRSNFCDYFRFRDQGAGAPKKSPVKSDSLNKLDDLFKK